jgi:hypothetical protein
MAIPKNTHKPAAFTAPSSAKAIEAVPKTSTAVRIPINVLLDI